MYPYIFQFFFIFTYLLVFFIYILAVPQTNSWQLETTNQDSTSTVNTPMDCKGKICFEIHNCKNERINTFKFKWIK